MNVYINGFDRKEVTFKATATAKEGASSTLISKNTVGVAPEDTHFIGVTTCVREGSAGVVLRGYVTVPYSGTAPSLGYVQLLADGNGGVKVSENGRYILVTDVDKTALTCGIVL